MAMLLYWGLMIIGLMWSDDRSWGLHVLGHQWFWLALPVVTATLVDARWRTRFMLTLSLGLTLHLGFCVMQKFGAVTIRDFGGSNAKDATGFIGHIGFGFIYGIWAGCLLHWGWNQSGWKRWGAWFVATWSWVMIFAAQGRSGYLTALAILLTVLWKHWISADWRKLVLPLVLLFIMGVVLAVGPGNRRLQLMRQDIVDIWHGDIHDTDPRWSMWIAAMDAWKSRPVLGVGTGGFPKAALAAQRTNPKLNFGNDPGQAPAHPHSMYFFSLARWGLFGLAAYLALVGTWIRTGWRLSWRLPESPAMALSGVALAMDGLFAPTMEQQGTGVMLVMMLGLQLSSSSASADAQNG